MIFPPYLSIGDKIAISAPASSIKPEYVDVAARILAQAGFTPVVMPHAKGKTDGYSGTLQERVSDFTDALCDDSIKAILCARGGYGTVQVLEHVSRDLISAHPKWVIGFSDISALHAAYHEAGIASLHAPMCKHIATRGLDDRYTRALFDTLCGEKQAYATEPHSYNRIGTARGEIVGGNMAVLGGLCGTRYDIYRRDTILFIEDIAEPVYKVERMLYQLKLSGVLPTLRALIVGCFTQYQADAHTGEDIPAMIRRMVSEYRYPTAFNFPVGHVDDNVTIVEGAEAHLEVTDNEVRLTFI